MLTQDLVSQPNHLHAGQTESLLFETGYDFTDQPSLNGTRL